MGRGRAKAKQTRVARELKYADAGTDLARLQAELNAAHAPEGDGGAGSGGHDGDGEERD